jgi:HEAT repeat protein
VAHPNVKMMLDLYHAQIGEGNLIDLVRRCGDAIGEVQIADVPGRCEPGTGEINYPAIAKALRDMEYGEGAPFLRGAKWVQFEPVWGGQADTAGSLRGICLLSLPACIDVRRETVMRYLVAALVEEDSAVRSDAARAIGAMGGEEAALLLRLKALSGDQVAAVTGQVFESLLSVERAEALEFLRPILRAEGGEAAEEAALAIGNSRLEAGVELLIEAWENARAEDYRAALLRSLGISRREPAVELLRRIAETGRTRDRTEAKAALELAGNSSARSG